jgi:asperthecin polyketide synthase
MKKDDRQIKEANLEPKTNPDIYCMLGKGHFLSKTGQCKVWDAGADGYCRADGVGSVVIKRLEDALADNDVVLATIAAGSTNHSAESISITQPHAGAQKDNYRQVLDQAGVNPLDVSFVELHGTGTQVGDAIESESVLDFFAPVGRRQRPEERLTLGAVKSNIGHGEAAAGIASLIKVLLMYQHGTIPPHIGIKTTMNPVVAEHLANRNAGIISGKNAPWLPISQSHGSKRYSIVNSFGAHGGNTTLLLEDAPDTTAVRTEPGEYSGLEAAVCEVVCVSAKSKASLRGNVTALLGYLDRHPEAELKDVAYTTSARRIHHHIRIAASVSSISQLRGFLQAAVDDIDSHARHVSAATKRSVVFAFSGQGCFYRGAAEQLMQRAPAFRHLVLQIDRLALQMGFPSILSAVSGGAASRIGHDAVNKTCPPSSTPSSTTGENGFEALVSSIKSISSTSVSTEPATIVDEESPLVTQLATVGLQIALAQYLMQLGITPSVVIGHSLGEYAALVAAGVLSVADALFLAGKRAQLMLAACEAGSHVMLSIRGASGDRIRELCGASQQTFHYDISCVNGRADTVVSGRREDMVALRDMLQGSHGLKCVLLDVPFAFHSAQLDPIADYFEQAAGCVTFKAPEIPVVSPLLGQCVSKGGIIDATYLRRATREPVDFVSALNAVVNDGLADSQSIWIDIGHHPVCTSFARNEKVATNIFASLRQGDDRLSTFTSTLATLHCLGLPVAWNEYFSGREKSHRLLHLDSYQWNLKNYWIPYDTTWTLDKAHAGAKETSKSMTSPPFFTSSVQQVISEEFDGISGRMVAMSNLAHPDMLGAADGHKINGRSVVTGVRLLFISLLSLSL